MDQEEYNGWTNYETWCVNLWLTNDRYMDRAMLDHARVVLDQIKDKGDVDPDNEIAAYRMGKIIEDQHDDWFEEERDAYMPNVFSDLLRASLAAVNWREIGLAYIETVRLEECK